MLNKLAIIALAATVSVPAFAADINAGRQMQADLLGLNASEFTNSELAQIAGEKTEGERATRAAYIVEQRNRGVSAAVAHDVQSYSANARRGHDN